MRRLQQGRFAPKLVGLWVLLGLLGMLVWITPDALAGHVFRPGAPLYEYPLGYTTAYRAAINYDHPQNDAWEAYGDHWGNDPGGGDFDKMTVKVWQAIRWDCGTWNYTHYNEATRTRVFQNWAYAGWEWNPTGACKKRRSHMEGHFWDYFGADNYYFNNYRIEDQ